MRCDRAGIGDTLNTECSCGLKNIHRAEHIDTCTVHGIGFAKRYLQSREMNNRLDVVTFDYRLQRVDIGNVAILPLHRLHLLFCHQQRRTARIAA